MRTKPPPPVERGAQLAEGYLCEVLLSRGEAFDVYGAWSLDRYCRCVVKLMRPDVTSAGLRRRLLFEGQLLTRLDHPHLLRGYEVRKDPALVASRPLSGYPLGRLLREGHRLTAGDLAHLAGQVCSALRYLHGAGYVHLDVKPANIVLESGLATLLDFSLVQRPGRVPRRTGTPRYMSPEQARGGAVGTAADVWGLGITLFEAATGQGPFAEAWQQISSAGCPTCHPTGPASGAASPPGLDGLPQERLRAPAVKSRRARLPRDLSSLIDACLEPDAGDRPTLDDVAPVLEQLTGLGPPLLTV